MDADAATAATTAVSGSFSFSAAAADGEMDAATAAVSAAKQSAGYFRGAVFPPLILYRRCSHRQPAVYVTPSSARITKRSRKSCLHQ